MLKLEKTVRVFLIFCLLAGCHTALAEDTQQASGAKDNSVSSARLTKALHVFLGEYRVPVEFNTSDSTPLYSAFLTKGSSQKAPDDEVIKASQLEGGNGLIHKCRSSDCSSQVLVVLDKQGAVKSAAYITDYKMAGSSSWAADRGQIVYIFQKSENYGRYIDFTRSSNQPILDWLEKRQKSDREFRVNRLDFVGIES